MDKRTRRGHQHASPMRPPLSARFTLALTALAGALLNGCATSTKIPTSAGPDRGVEVIFRAPLQYPAALVKAGVTGTVVVEFVVATDGLPKDARVIEAPNPLLGEAAVESISHWKFRPALKDGRPVNSLNRQEIGFKLPGQESRPSPPNVGLNTPPQAIHRVPPQFPLRLNERHISGGAIVEFTVTTDGNVEDARVVKATHFEFGQAALECISQWKFRPAMINGKPVNARQRQLITFDFGN